MYKLNDISFETYGILPGRIQGEGIAVKGIFDLPKRIGDIEHSWGDEDSVDPFVGSGEIFLGGRDIEFQGIIIGSENLIKSYLTALKNAISAFVNTVPLETPYGNACVYVKNFDVKHYNGGATISIHFREPVVGAVCGINVPPSTYYSAEFSAQATRNNCEDTHNGTEVTLTATAGQFQSPVSQAAANQLAVDWVLENIQDYANVNGTCVLKPVVYYNVKLSGSLQKECAPGYEGTWVTYTVEAYKYQSLISQVDVDAMAQAELDANLTQEYANAQGICKLVYLSEEVSGDVQKEGCGPGTIGEVVTVIISAGAHTSTLSQAHANALAQADFNMQAQDFANNTGGCIQSPSLFKLALLYEDHDPNGWRHYFISYNSTNSVIGTYVLQFKHDNGKTFKFIYVENTVRPQKNTMALIHAKIDSTLQAEWNTLAGEVMYGGPSYYPGTVPFGQTGRFIVVYKPWKIEKVWLSL